MKINFQPDFIYTVNGFSATLILHNCEYQCKFCPAAQLKNFRNHTELNSIFDFTCRDLTIYGNVKNSYFENFLVKLKNLNPEVKIKIIACGCELSQKIDIEYRHLIHPELEPYFEIMPKSFILIPSGEPEILQAFALKNRMTYPDIPIDVEVLDTSNPDAEFLSPEQIEELKKQIEMYDHRI